MDQLHERATGKVEPLAVCLELANCTTASIFRHSVRPTSRTYSPGTDDVVWQKRIAWHEQETGRTTCFEAEAEFAPMGALS